jgi:hypothetical protein
MMLTCNKGCIHLMCCQWRDMHAAYTTGSQQASRLEQVEEARQRSNSTSSMHQVIVQKTKGLQWAGQTYVLQVTFLTPTWQAASWHMGLLQ